MKKKRRVILFVLLLLLICTPIPIKTAVDAPVRNGDTAEIQTMDSFVGTQVRVLCERSETEVTDPDDYEFIIIAIEQDGSFKEIPRRENGAFMMSTGLYVYPVSFVGRAVKDYNWGSRNAFIFCGELERATAADGKSYLNNYRIRLSAWEIVYPIHHFELYLLPRNKFFNSHLFILDFLF